MVYFLFVKSLWIIVRQMATSISSLLILNLTGASLLMWNMSQIHESCASNCFVLMSDHASLLTRCELRVLYYLSQPLGVQLVGRRVSLIYNKGTGPVKTHSSAEIHYTHWSNLLMFSWHRLISADHCMQRVFK